MSLILGLMYIFIIGIVIASMAVLLLMGKKEKYNIMCLGCQTMVIIWCISQIMILLSGTHKELVFSYILGNVGVCFVGAFWFSFAVLYSGLKLPPLIHYFPFLLSSLHYIIILTNNMHHLYYMGFTKEEVTHGIFFYTNVMQTYLFVVAGAVILYRSIERERKNTLSGMADIKTVTETNIAMRTNTVTETNTAMETNIAKILIIIAVFVPIIFNAFYLTGILNVSFDITPLGFGISIILVLFATIKYRFMEVNIEAFDTVLSGLSDGVAIFDKNGRCTFYNSAFGSYIGDECILNTKIINSQIVSMDLIEENVYMDADKKYYHVQVYQKFADSLAEITPDNIDFNKPVVFVLKDISRYYELLHQTRELAVANEKLAIEQERNRIAQQVHDTAGHTLTMIQSYMKLAQISIKKHEEIKTREYLEGAEGLASKGIKELRESINMLRSKARDQMVAKCILQLADSVKEILVDVTIQGEDSYLYSHLSQVLYECVRESVTNTLKYAKAGKLDIVIKFMENAIELIIADDGIGCAKIQDNNGLLGIRERVEKEGGTVRFTSGENEGFLTCIRIPVHKNAY